MFEIKENICLKQIKLFQLTEHFQRKENYVM
jgi:hypothetical protein